MSRAASSILFFRNSALGAAFASWMLATGCGYSVHSTHDGSPSQAVAVPLFDNRTFEPLLDARVTDRVKSRLIAAGSWRLVGSPQRADLVIRGAVTSFGVTAVSFDAANRPFDQRVEITAEVIAERSDGERRKVTVAATAEFTETTNTLATRAAKNRAIEEAGENLARDLVARLVALDLHRAARSGQGPPAAPSDPAGHP